jgi:hypothetical protein
MAAGKSEVCWRPHFSYLHTPQLRGKRHRKSYDSASIPLREEDILSIGLTKFILARLVNSLPF